MIRELIHKYFTWKSLRCLCSVALVLLLCACSDDSDTSSGKDTNYKEQSACWQAKIIDVVLSQINSLLSGAAGKVADGGAGVVMLGFSIWMCFKLLKVLPSFKEENLGEVWTEIGQKLFLCAFCAVAVSNTGYIYWAIDTFAVPLYTAILGLGSDILISIKSGTSVDLGIFGTVTFDSPHTKCGVPEVDSHDFRGSVQPMASCLACQINSRLNSGIKLGIELIALLELGTILVGITLLLIFTAAKFGFIFFIVDGLFRLNFAALLFPLLIMGVPFNYTRKWSKFGLEMFLNSSGIMLFMGTLICIAIGALETTLSLYDGTMKVSDLAGQGPVLLSLLLISTLLINIPGMGVALADKFIGGGLGLEFQKQVSQFVMNTAKRAGAAILGGVTGGATSTITGTLEKYEKTREALDSVRQERNSANTTLNKLAGYN